jgi:hypothetical protein
MRAVAAIWTTVGWRLLCPTCLALHKRHQGSYRGIQSPTVVDEDLPF